MHFSDKEVVYCFEYPRLASLPKFSVTFEESTSHDVMKEINSLKQPVLIGLTQT